MAGWVKLHRSIFEWEWYDDHNVTRLFLHLLLLSNHESKNWKGVPVLPGQCVTGRLELAESVGLSHQKIRTALHKLKSTNEITIKTTTKYSLITICKWHEYQSIQPTTQPTNNQQITTPKELKKERNTPLPPEGDVFWLAFKIFPPKRKGASDKSYRAWLKAISRGNSGMAIYEAVQIYSVSLEATKEGGKYAAGMAAWLNDDGFLKEWTAAPKKALGWVAAQLGGG